MNYFLLRKGQDSMAVKQKKGQGGNTTTKINKTELMKNLGGDKDRVAYVRVSTVEQNEARQVEALKNYNIGMQFTDKKSGKDTNRPAFQLMMEYLREGDTLYVHDFSRLARNTRDLMAISDELKTRGIHLVSIKENVDTSTATGQLMFNMIAVLAEFERANLLERQREGIELAKLRGVYKGRKPIQVEDFGDWYDKYKTRQINKVDLAKQLNISRPTLDKLFKEYEEKLAQ